MKIRAKANGNILDMADGEAEALLATGIYEPVDTPRTKPPKAPKAPTVAPATQVLANAPSEQSPGDSAGESTAAARETPVMTTQDVPFTQGKR